MNGTIALKKAKRYTDESLLGGGAITGKNVIISSIVSIDGGNRITFSYTLDDGTEKTSIIDVMDGKDGIDGKTIINANIDDANNFTITLSDDTVITVGTLQTVQGDKGDNGITPHIDETTGRWFIGDIDTGYQAVIKDTISFNDLTDVPTIPTSLSQLTNDENFIKNTVSNLLNYYSKSEVYTKDEITSLVSDINKQTTSVVDALEAKVGTVPDGTTVMGAIDNIKKSAYDDAEVRGLIQTNTDAISATDGKVTALIGTDTSKSVRTIANEELAAQLIPETAKESLDTLAEIAAWIQSHPDDASAMNQAITALQTLVGTIPEGITATTIAGYIQELVTAEKTRAEEVESGLDGRIGTVETTITEGGSVALAIADAKKAGTDAQSDVDTLVTRVDSLESATEKNASVSGSLATQITALNKNLGMSYAANVKDLNNPPKTFLLNTSVNPTGFPTGLGGNGCCVIQHNFGQGSFAAQIAFGFTTDKIAIRRRNESENWTDWKYIEAGMNNAGAHNAIYRGKYLGNTVTTAQYAVISAGTFNDLYIGDYWTIGGVNYRIASFDYYLNSGDTSCTTHHAVIVPDTCLYSAQMHNTTSGNYESGEANTTTGGYVGSDMYTSNLKQAKTTIKSVFSGHVLKHRVYLTNAVANDHASGGAWCDSEVDLMCEQMVYGSGIFSPVSDGSNVPANYRVEKSQLPLFQHEPSRICNRATWWLRDVITASLFAFVTGDGLAFYYVASDSLGVRPAFCIS